MWLQLILGAFQPVFHGHIGRGVGWQNRAKDHYEISDTCPQFQESSDGELAGDYK
jgi:hypothetical protein